jgi:hypothetical protein
MSGAEFGRRDRSDGDRLIPRVSRETRFKFQDEIDEFHKSRGNDYHLAATYLERINKVNPIVAEYIAGLAGKTPEGLNLTHVSTCVVLAGVCTYRLLELEFEQRGKKMPIVEKEIADSLQVDIAQEERYFLKLAKSLKDENAELLLALSAMIFMWIVRFSREKEQVSPLVIESGLGVYALIKAQAEGDSRGGQIEQFIVC